jgi:hypothetical protein
MNSGRSRKNIVDVSTSSASPISINYVLPFNATLLQYCLSYNDGDPHGDPALPDILTISKLDGSLPYINPILRIHNVGLDVTRYVVCNEPFQFMKDQHFIVTCGNGSDRNVGFEAIFEEGS